MRIVLRGIPVGKRLVRGDKSKVSVDQINSVVLFPACDPSAGWRPGTLLNMPRAKPADVISHAIHRSNFTNAHCISIIKYTGTAEEERVCILKIE
ncbi:hypothetical protein Trydic_g13946 [Trypoxylus dichotomus]